MGAIIIGVLAAITGYVLRLVYAKVNAKSAEQISERIVKEAKMVAETKTKEALLEAKVIVDRERKEFEHDIKERKQ